MPASVLLLQLLRAQQRRRLRWTRLHWRERGRPLLQQLREANEDPALLPSMTWYPALQQLQLALVTAMAALSTARLPRDNYIVSQACIILVSVAGCAPPPGRSRRSRSASSNTATAPW